MALDGVGKLVTLGVLLAVGDKTAVAEYVFTTLAFSGNPTGISDNGQITGAFSDAQGIHGFVYSAGTYTVIEDPAAPELYRGLRNQQQRTDCRVLQRRHRQPRLHRNGWYLHHG